MPLQSCQCVLRGLKLPRPWRGLKLDPGAASSLTLARPQAACPHSSTTRADAIAASLATNPALEAAASNISQACSFAMVPKPPVSFDAISACVNTAMVVLNGTTFGAAA